MQESDFTDFKDISEVEINRELSPSEKKTQYIKKTGGGTVYKVGETTVKCSYGDKMLEEMLSDLLFDFPPKK